MEGVASARYLFLTMSRDKNDLQTEEEEEEEEQMVNSEQDCRKAFLHCTAAPPLSNFSNFLSITTIICGCPGLSRAVYTPFQGGT